MITATWRGITPGFSAEDTAADRRFGIAYVITQPAPRRNGHPLLIRRSPRRNRSSPPVHPHYRAETPPAGLLFNSSASRIVRAISSCNPTRYRAASAFNGSTCA